jgi:peptidoglycan hydrolase-like protein with peptidoglycan-binding domain
MRYLGATLAVLVGLSGIAIAQAQPAGAQEAGDVTSALPNGNNHAAPRASVTAPSAIAKPSLKDSYAAISLGERIAIESDLVWASHYNGPVNGEFSDQFVNAVRVFQVKNKFRPTGVLNPAERQALAELVRPLQEQVGWRIVNDAATGARLGLPIKLAPRAIAIKDGSSWSSAQGQVRIETFRILGPDTDLAATFEQMKKEPAERKIEQQALRPDSFAIAGMQGLKKFHVRAFVRNGEIRGMTILYDQAMDGTMDPLMPIMANAFQPFATPPKAAADTTVARRKVEYGTGLVVSSVGHIVTDLQVVDSCQQIVIPGIGHAERVAEDTDNGLALVRVYGPEDLVPLALLGEPPKGPDLTLIGIADPQTQAGNAAISTTTARLVHTASTSGTVTTLNQTPAIGFSGAAAVDKNGRFVGMVGLKIPVVAGATPAAPKATIVSAETIKNFIEANYVAPTSGQPGVEQCKSSIVRVICVRK